MQPNDISERMKYTFAEPDAEKVDFIFTDMSLGCIPQASVCGKKVKGAHLDFVVRVHALDGVLKHRPVFFVSELHRLFLTLLDVFVDSDNKFGVGYRREGFHQHPRLWDLPLVDSLLHTGRFFARHAPFLLSVGTLLASAPFGVVLGFFAHKNAVSSRTEVRRFLHHLFYLSIVRVICKNHKFLLFLEMKKAEDISITRLDYVLFNF